MLLGGPSGAGDHQGGWRRNILHQSQPQCSRAARLTFCAAVGGRCVSVAGRSTGAGEVAEWAGALGQWVITIDGWVKYWVTCKEAKCRVVPEYRYYTHCWGGASGAGG